MHSESNISGKLHCTPKRGVLQQRTSHESHQQKDPVCVRGREGGGDFQTLQSEHAVDSHWLWSGRQCNATCTQDELKAKLPVWRHAGLLRLSASCVHLLVDRTLAHDEQ